MTDSVNMKNGGRGNGGNRDLDNASHNVDKQVHDGHTITKTSKENHGNINRAKTIMLKEDKTGDFPPIIGIK